MDCHALEQPYREGQSGQKSETSTLWRSEYPNDPFEVDLSPGAKTNDAYVKGNTDFSYNIIDAADRQKEFYYQVIHTFKKNTSFCS